MVDWSTLFRHLNRLLKSFIAFFLGNHIQDAACLGRFHIDGEDELFAGIGVFIDFAEFFEEDGGFGAQGHDELFLECPFFVSESLFGIKFSLVLCENGLLKHYRLNHLLLLALDILLELLELLSYLRALLQGLVIYFLEFERFLEVVG